MIVLIKMNYIQTAKPYHLNPQASANKLVGYLFGWRKKDTSDAHKVCPYCGTHNEIEAEECKLCYYDLTASAREQPMATPSTTESDIMTTLLDEDIDDEEGEDYAVEAVLSLDDVTVQIDQFESQDEGENDEFAFIASSGPTLSEVQDYTKPEEVSLSPDDAPRQQVEFVLPNANPLDEVAEPVHTGQGSLFLEADNSDDDFSGSVGPSQGRNMEPEIIAEEPAQSELEMSTAKVESVVSETPDLPDIFGETTVEQQLDSHTQTPLTTPDIPDIPEAEEPQGVDETPEVPDIPNDPVAEQVKAETKQSAAPPKPELSGRIWPWPAKQPWDDRVVYREVVSMLELIKTGKLTQTAQQLDRLGPHLDANLDMLAHIGTIMRYLGREEHLQWMLQMAKATYPNDVNVARALTHLS